MNVVELSNRFDIQYDNIATNSAPNIDEYEKSIYLTRAQQQIIKNYFNSKGNKYREGFEGNTKRRYDLEALVKHQNCYKEPTKTSNGISLDSQFFSIPAEVFLIVQEQAFSKDKRIYCNTDIEQLDDIVKSITKNSKKMKVIPITHDEFDEKEENPFKNPDENNIWRLTYNYLPYYSNKKVVELISPYDIKLYKLRYVKYPDPIILVNLRDKFPGETLTIDGEYKTQTCKLSKATQLEVIDRAVELAKLDYEYDSLQGRIQLNTRNE